MKEAAKTCIVPRYEIKLVRNKGTRFEVEHLHNQYNKIASMVDTIYNLKDATEESVILVCYDTKLKPIGTFEVSRGSMTQSCMHARDVLKRALLLNSYAIVLVHNHPSGDPTPSAEDITVTKKMIEACKIVGVPLLDHIIIGSYDVSIRADYELWGDE